MHFEELFFGGAAKMQKLVSFENENLESR